MTSKTGSDRMLTDRQSMFRLTGNHSRGLACRENSSDLARDEQS